VLLFLFSEYTANGQKKRKSNKKEDQTAEQTEEDKKLLNEIQYYNVITPLAKTDSGLFIVHLVEDKYYFEIPQQLLEKDILLISRIAKIPNGLGGGYINAGIKMHEQVVRWEKKYDKILLRTKSFINMASDSLPINLSVQTNNYEPIIHAFDIKTYNPDSTNLVIDVTKFFTCDIKAISGLNAELREDYKVSKLDEDRSFIDQIYSYPENVEVRHELTYTATKPPEGNTTGAISLLMNQSMILLPDEPMMPRFHDPRVGWLTLSRIDYGSVELKADTRKIIRRWRLEPSDKEAYARGELVEPIKPIVYYLAPATPEIWRPYFKAGIELWQEVFETAGFKNAILARDPPSKEEDPEFSPEDVRYSVVRYVASTTRNAMGPSVSDPRSGEIIESDIMWYHNHFRTYRNRYLVETGAANPSARSLQTPEEDMGEMIKMVIAHEVGHALGLPHNMKASSAYPVDSMRSGTFTQEFGIAATIMDYARFNYVAQPGDEDIRFIRQIGPYDHYSINWGYRWLPGMEGPDSEKQILDSWIMEKAGDPVYRFGSGRGGFDPSAQTENIGNDPVKASEYGIENLKIVSENLIDWTSQEGKEYSDLKELYSTLVRTWGMYSRHVLTNIGGVYQTQKTTDEDGLVYEIVPADIQSASLGFLNEYVFRTPEWIINENILRRIEPSGEIKRISDVQKSLLNALLEKERMLRIVEAESFLDEDTYSLQQMMQDLRSGIWNDLEKNISTDAYKRNLQLAWIDRMSLFIHKPADKDKKDSSVNADISALALDELNSIKDSISLRKDRIRSSLAKSHYLYCLKRIEDELSMDSK
jgi:hypothetical protein